jgi:hypothetical protein
MEKDENAKIFWGDGATRSSFFVAGIIRICPKEFKLIGLLVTNLLFG